VTDQYFLDHSIDRTGGQAGQFPNNDCLVGAPGDHKSFRSIEFQAENTPRVMVDQSLAEFAGLDGPDLDGAISRSCYKGIRERVELEAVDAITMPSEICNCGFEGLGGPPAFKLSPLSVEVLPVEEEGKNTFWARRNK